MLVEFVLLKEANECAIRLCAEALLVVVGVVGRDCKEITSADSEDSGEHDSVDENVN